MRMLAIALATTAAVVASPALARDGAWYVGGEFGGMIVEDTDIDTNGVEDAIRLNYRHGFDGGLFVGWDLGAFRLEAEAAYKEADLDEIDSLLVLPGGALPGLRDAGGGSIDAMSFMLNGMLDFGDDDGVSGFAGAGAGFAKVGLGGARAFANRPEFLDDSDSGLAWQVFAGLRQAISDNADITVKYRFFNAPDLGFDDGVRDGETRFRSHSLLGGITFNFGGVEAPPPPPPPPPRVVAPPPPPPPAPQMQTCPNGQRIPVTQACPAPPPPPVPQAGERG